MADMVYVAFLSVLSGKISPPEAEHFNKLSFAAA